MHARGAGGAGMTATDPKVEDAPEPGAEDLQQPGSRTSGPYPALTQGDPEEAVAADAAAAADAGGAAVDLLAGYTPPPGAWDEVIGADGVRPHWHYLVEHLGRFGPDELARRRDQARRLMRENGVTYNVYAEPHGLDRPWLLDPVPLVMPASEWDALARGLSQRARLLDAILADLYGPQRLLREGLIPPAAVFGHPAFLRPCHGLDVPGGRRLLTYAADLVRAPDGRWLVAADRAQSPAGAGYALENRIVLSRVLPEAFRDCGVRRLAGFFIALRQTLLALAPRHQDNPRIVLLTPGPYHDAYFEHAYLARYLGYPLVEGGDLTVRDETVYLKTLGGLHPVDVILRRQDDDFCDPLELRNDSTLGVAGLVQAARSGHVAVVNALGSGLAENAALMPVLPDLCLHLLGEELMLPSVETYWAGDDLEHIEGHLDEMVLRPAFGRGEPVMPAQLDESAREELLGQVRARRHAWVAQRLPPMSTTPALADGGTRPTPRALALRAFAVAAGDGYEVMPGGMARIIPDAAAALSMRRGGSGKDVWVLAEGPVAPVSLLRPANARLTLSRGSIELPSRVADNLFWLGRYGERAEDHARLLRCLVMHQNDDPETATGGELAALLQVARHLGLQGAGSKGGRNPARHAWAMVGDAERPGSVRDCLRRLRQAGFAVRDRLSNDTWRIIDQLEAELPPGSSGPPEAAELLPALNRLITGCSALAGMGMENTTRGSGWRFMDLGRRLERALFTVEVLRALLASDKPQGEAALEAALEVADSAITYRSRYLTSLQAPAVLDLLLTDDSNPRSAGFQLDLVAAHVAKLPRDRDQALPTAAERLALGTHTWVRLVDPFDLCRFDERGGRPALAHFLDHLASDLCVLSDTITTQYLSHAHASPNQPSVPPLRRPTEPPAASTRQASATGTFPAIPAQQQQQAPHPPGPR
jgi:uncharacterized circularly permuted ATP-grasp superfamily protein/uncharacterized alpha-E superfamily protein